MTPYGNDTINDSASAFHECLSSVDNYNRELQSLGERITEFYNRTSRASVAYQNITDSCLSMPPNFMERSFEFVNAHFAIITADVNLAYLSYSENSTVEPSDDSMHQSVCVYGVNSFTA